MDTLTKKDHFEYAWRHFSVIADQRLKTFNFYIIMVAATVVATLASFDKQNAFWILIACGILHMVCAVVFFLIDERSKRLVVIAKDVLIEFEVAKDWKLFRKDVELQKSNWNQFTSYTYAFGLAFFSQFIFGVFVLIMAFNPNLLGLPSSRAKSINRPSIPTQKQVPIIPTLDSR